MVHASAMGVRSGAQFIRPTLGGNVSTDVVDAADAADAAADASASGDRLHSFYTCQVDMSCLLMSLQAAAYAECCDGMEVHRASLQY